MKHPRRQLRARAHHQGGARAGPRHYEARGYRFSYDMLGERAKTAADAERYFDRYMAAIEAIGEARGRELRRCRTR